VLARRKTLEKRETDKM